ncbi:Crp/Fnr family transcriptional regulator [Kitasatospora sp. NPDC088391]|uniref:Crp/Fnr family transcriptional regulator n=1 Tax=Kitasatospora sp. NPDC088391 TaxID=3364074 RepID=UPI003828FCC1
MTDPSYMSDRSPFLCALSAGTRAALERIGGTRDFSTGEVLITEGDEQHDLWCLLEGKVKVTCLSDGRKPSLVDLKGACDVVGEIAAMDCGMRSATVTACADGAARVIPRGALEPFLLDHPDAMHALHQVVGDRLRRSDRQRLEFGRYPVLVRLARVLLELAEAHGTSTAETARIDVNMTHSELASLVGAKTGTVQKALAELGRNGLIETGEKRTHIRSKSGLRRVAQGHTSLRPVKYSA